MPSCKISLSRDYYLSLLVTQGIAQAKFIDELCWISDHMRMRTKVDNLGNQDADGDGQLEHDVELAADLDGGNLAEVQRHCLCGKTCRKMDALLGHQTRLISQTGRLCTDVAHALPHIATAHGDLWSAPRHRYRERLLERRTFAEQKSWVSKLAMSD